MTSASAPDSMFLPWFSALASLKERLCPSQIDQINVCSSLPATFYPLSSPSVSFLPQVFLIPTLSAFFCLFLFSSSHSFSITFFFTLLCLCILSLSLWFSLILALTLCLFSQSFEVLCLSVLLRWWPHILSSHSQIKPEKETRELSAGFLFQNLKIWPDSLTLSKLFAEPADCRFWCVCWFACLFVCFAMEELEGLPEHPFIIQPTKYPSLYNPHYTTGSRWDSACSYDVGRSGAHTLFRVLFLFFFSCIHILHVLYSSILKINVPLLWLHHQHLN